MTVTLGPRLGLMANAAAGDTHPNELRAFLRGMDALCQISAKSRTTAAQPASPASGDVYILPASPTGAAWSGKAAGTIAYYIAAKTTTSAGVETTAAGWDFLTPKRGFFANVEDEADACYRHDGSTWQVYSKDAAFTPTAANLAGTVSSIVGQYSRVGGRTDFTIRVQGTGLVATGATITLPFTPARASVASVVTASLAQSGAAQVATDGKVYLPNLSATTVIDISGTIFHS